MDKAFLIAVEHGDVKKVKRLLPYVSPIVQSNALYYAVSDSPSITKLLLTHALGLSTAYDVALRKATQSGAFQATKLLLTHGADVHTHNDKLLEEASESGNTPLVQLLLTYGADVHANQETALIVAVNNGHVDDTVELLLKYGAIPSYEYMVEIAVMKCRNIKILKLLVVHGANVHAHDDCAFYFAVQYGYTEKVKFLLPYIQDINANYGYALRLASENGHIDTVKLLLAHGADLKHIDSDCMERIRRNGYLTIVRLILKHRK